MPESKYEDQPGVRTGAEAKYPGVFIEQQSAPLFFSASTEVTSAETYDEITSEQDFWEKSGRLLLGLVRLKNFRLSDWFPRAPGIHWSLSGFAIRQELQRYPIKYSAGLDSFYLPDLKMGLIERGGIDAIRLRPRKIDGVDCWLGTAGTGTHCHSGVPLAIPDKLLRKCGVEVSG